VVNLTVLKLARSASKVKLQQTFDLGTGFFRAAQVEPVNTKSGMGSLTKQRTWQGYISGKDLPLNTTYLELWQMSQSSERGRTTVS
jgi:hypothetical protein